MIECDPLLCPSVSNNCDKQAPTTDRCCLTCTPSEDVICIPCSYNTAVIMYFHNYRYSRCRGQWFKYWGNSCYHCYSSFGNFNTDSYPLFSMLQANNKTKVCINTIVTALAKRNIPYTCNSFNFSGSNFA